MKPMNCVLVVAVLFAIILSGTCDVLISTYMRSGSTFLGRILGWRNDSFYFYEPLWKPHIWQYFREDGRICSYLTPTCLENDTSANTSLKRAQYFLKDFYQCRLAIHSDYVDEQLHAQHKLADPDETAPVGAVSSGSSLFTGPSWEPFRLCRCHNISVKECMSEMEPTCQSAKHRVTKVLRMDVLHMSELLSVLPRLKVVLLLRDPRGILNSHLRTKWFPMHVKPYHVFENDAKVVCSRMERDMQSASLLTKRFWDRVKIVQYEDLGESFESVNALYRFMGMRQLNNDMIENLSDISTGPVQHDPFSFRHTMSWDVMKIIDKHCRKLYRKLGLVQYTDLNHLRNQTLPSIISKLPYTL